VALICGVAGIATVLASKHLYLYISVKINSSYHLWLAASPASPESGFF